jgi:hypothetical protein
MPDSDSPLLDRRMTLGLLGATATGGVAGIGLPTWWRHGGKGTSVLILGCGKTVSVLMTHNQRRVLIASGNNGVMFANALGRALPPLAPKLDVLLLDPKANGDVQQRARALQAALFIELPDPGREPGYETIREAALIKFDDDVSMAVDPGSSTWIALLRKNGDRIAIVPDTASTAHLPPVLVSLSGGVSFPNGTQAIFGPSMNGADAHYYGVAPGDTKRLFVDSDAVTFRP